jgi:hypothetical protein
MWKTIVQMLEHAKVPQYVTVQNYLVRTYVATICTGVRRECDTDSRSSSLAGCLEALVACPHFASRERYRSLLSSELEARDAREAEAGYDAFAPDGESSLRADLVGADLAQLKVAAQPVRRYTNKVLAHRDRAESRKPEPISLTFDEMHEALDQVGLIARKYYRLRNPGVELASLTPHADFTFLTMFQHAWWTPGFVPPDALKLG